MDNSWTLMLQKITSIGNGLLRFHDRNGRVVLKVNVAQSDSPSTVSLRVSPGDYREKLVHHSASFTQRTGNGYLYVTGYLSGSRKNNEYLLNMNVFKAYWFERKGVAPNKWMEEICMYEQLERTRE